MKYPVMNKSPKRQVNIPALDGGLNTRDTKTGILDNQLSDVKNMWYNNGALCKRPNFETNADMSITIWDYANSAQFNSKFHSDISYNGKTLLSLSSIIVQQLDTEVRYTQDVEFYWQGKTGCQHFGKVSFDVKRESLIDFFVNAYDNIVYVFFNNGKIYKHIFGDSGKKFAEISDIDKYIPVIYTNGLQTKSGFTADQINSPNIIGNYGKMIYSTVNPAYEEPNNQTMSYELPKIDNDELDLEYGYTGMIVKAVITYADKIVEHSVTLDISGTGNEETLNEYDNLRMLATTSRIWFSDSESSDDAAAIAPEAIQILNNLEITFPVLTDFNKPRVFGCRFSEWYGGVSEGINGGTRLFVSGNTDNGSLVYWSDLNNPLYFPKNNYFNVGTTGSRVTAFGKQNEKLVIFKENETWYTEYTQTTSPEAESVKNQSFIGLSTANAIFPLVLINDSIGCDCPDTVQLCRNRLVFTNSNGKVYVIVTMNQYSENNIYEIGGMVENLLKSENVLIAAKSADFGGHYCIIAGQKMYLCDYNSYGFQYAYSFKNEDDSQVRIPWYVWELPFADGNYFFLGDSIFYGKWNMIDEIPVYNRGKYYVSSVLLESNAGILDKSLELIHPEESGQPLDFVIKEDEIESSFASKLFTFGAPDMRKNIERVGIFTGDNKGQEITVRFITESGAETETYFANVSDMSDCKTILPYTKSTAKFGIEMSSKGELTVEGITLIYRMLGVIR